MPSSFGRTTWPRRSRRSWRARLTTSLQTSTCLSEPLEITSVPTDIESDHDDIMYPDPAAFVAVHAGCLAAIWSGVSWHAIAIGIVLYWLRMFAITAGYHRYFSHRAYATSRVFQFILAFLAQSSAQKSVLWWAAKHRHHHLHSDTENDVHSPRHKGFVYSHVGWIFHRSHDGTDLVKVEDFASYPELMWLHRFELLPAIIVGTLVLHHRRMVRARGRLLLEHRAAVSRNVLHQLACACSRTQALCDGRRLPQQLAARSGYDG